jgi:hypothetical protein
MQKLNLGLAVGAGFLGGALSHYSASYFTQATAHAQTLVSPVKDVTAQSFVLVDPTGTTVGTFKASSGQSPTVVFTDRNGREIWRAGTSVKVLSDK